MIRLLSCSSKCGDLRYCENAKNNKRRVCSLTSKYEVNRVSKALTAITLQTPISQTLSFVLLLLCNTLIPLK